MPRMVALLQRGLHGFWANQAVLMEKGQKVLCVHGGRSMYIYMNENKKQKCTTKEEREDKCILKRQTEGAEWSKAKK